VNLTEYDTVGTLAYETYDGTKLEAIITAEVDSIVTISDDETDAGISDEAITTGLVGSVETTMYDDLGPDGIEFGVTNGVVNNNGVGAETIDDEPTEVGTLYEAMITAVVSGIETMLDDGTESGTDE